jgi:hypothetical protein
VWFLPFRLSNQNCLPVSYLHHPCYMNRLSHSSWLDNPNNIWWRVSPQIMKLLIMQSSTSPCHLILLILNSVDEENSVLLSWILQGYVMKSIRMTHFLSLSHRYRT